MPRETRIPNQSEAYRRHRRCRKYGCPFSLQIDYTVTDMKVLLLFNMITLS